MANLTLRSIKGSALTHAELDGNFEYFTGSIDAINDATASFLTDADTGSFLTSADTASFLTSEDTGSLLTTSQTASINISDAKYTVNTALSASGTSASTTSVCSYGVNVFEYVTPTNRATKLPQPVTGKSIRIMNNSTSLLYVYPSNVGGQINNYPVDTPAVLPPDGKPYEFICIENPLPGAWTFSAPATGQFDSGEIEVSVTSGTLNGGFNPVVSAYSATQYSTGSFSSSTVAFDGKNQPTVVVGSLGEIAFRPDSVWKGISKVKVYTNLISTQSAYVRIYATGAYGYYSLADGSFLNGTLGGAGYTIFEFDLDKTVPGTAVTGSTSRTSANIGDAGTYWMEKVAFEDADSNVNLGANSEGTIIGNLNFGDQIPYPYDYFGIPGNPTPDASGNDIYKGDPVNKYYSSYLSFQILPLGNSNYGVIPDFKFRFIIEYYQ
jgi:hypothetical protein